jgi:two-component system, LytTR family, response regulator LytT
MGRVALHRDPGSPAFPGADGVTERGLDVLVVDDEASALADLARQLRSLAETAEVCTAASGQEALRILGKRPFDAVFLAVRLPGLARLELARMLERLETPPAVVLTSASETGAVGAFRPKALDHLMKPVSPRRLAEAIRRVRESRGHAAERERPDDVVPLPTMRGGIRLVPRESILFLQADGDYVRVICDDERFLLRGRVSDLARRWRRYGFVQVHRGYVANLRRAVEVRPMLNGTAMLAFPDGREIPVARRKVAELRRELVV